MEDGLKRHTPMYSHTEKLELGHSRIEIRAYRVFDGLDIMTDKEKWGGQYDDYRI